MLIICQRDIYAPEERGFDHEELKMGQIRCTLLQLTMLLFTFMEYCTFNELCIHPLTFAASILALHDITCQSVSNWTPKTYVNGRYRNSDGNNINWLFHRHS